MSWCGWPEGGTSRASYGDAFADVYDQWYPPGVGDKATIDLIVELAAGRPVLELGVGTGRIAGEIAARGLSVWGVDSSAAMLEQLAAKPAGRHVSTVVGDMAKLVMPEDAPRFGVVFVAFNTFFCLESSDAQGACLQRAAAVIAPTGRIVVDAFVPTTPPASSQGQVEVARIGPDGVVLKVSKWLEVEAVVAGCHIEISGTSMRLRPWRLHPIGLGELDTLAAAASLQLEARYAGWNRSPFRPASRQHVSVYKRHRA